MSLYPRAIPFPAFLHSTGVLASHTITEGRLYYVLYVMVASCERWTVNDSEDG